MTKLQKAYFKWVSLRCLVVDAVEARDIPADHWKLRQDAWSEYCDVRDEAFPKKEPEVARRAHRVTSKEVRGGAEVARFVNAGWGLL